MEEQATIPVEETEVNEEVSEELEATPAEGTEELEEVTEEEQEQVDLVAALTKSGSIPKGVEPFQDKDGTVKFVMPINGQKYIVNFNQLLSGFNLNQAGEQKLKEGKELEHKFTSFLKNVSAQSPEGKKELKKFITKMGYDIGELGEDFLSEVVNEQQMTPQERELKQKLAEIEEREKKLNESEMTERQKKERAEILTNQEQYSKDIVTVMKSKLSDNLSPALKQKIFIKVVQEMKDALSIDKKLSADQALDSVLTEYDLLLENAHEVYSKEHLKHRIPKEFKKLVMDLGLEDQAPLVANSVQGGAVELENYEDTRTKKPKKKTLLSEWQPKI